MKKINNILSGIILTTLIFCQAIPAGAAKQDRKADKPAAVSVTLTVLDESGNGIRGAEMISSEGAISRFSDETGAIKAEFVPGEVLIFRAAGYQELSVAFSRNDIPDNVTLMKTRATASGSGAVSAVSAMSGRPMDSFSDLVYSNGLQGRLAGLAVVSSGSGLGNNVPSLYVRGLHRNSGNEAIVLVDGMERDIDDIISEEVESIEVLKDASAKILYGSRAANGVISVTTRRGRAGQRVVNAGFESGVRMVTRTPEYLNSYQYATLYNEACINDGLSPLYSAEQLQGYKNSTGPNDLLYPDVNHYDLFMRNTALTNKATVDMMGGNERIQYSVVMNYIGGKGFEKVGKLPSLDRINLRGNIDATVTDYMKIFVNLGTRLETRSWGAQNQVANVTAFTTLRPNEYPLTIPAAVLGLEPDEDGVPFFGASTRSADNIFATMGYGGFNSEVYITSQADFGANFDFENYVPGLKAFAVFRIDNYEYFAEGQTDTHETYAIHNTATDVASLEFLKMRNTSLESNKSRNGASLYRQMSYEGNVSYAKTIGQSEFGARLGYSYYTKENSGVTQDIRNDNTSLKLNYGLSQKYFLEATAALMGSNRFAKGNRNFLAYSAGAAWVLSNEEFLSGSSAVDFLKLKASFGLLGYDGSTSYLLYNTRWTNGSTVTFGEKNATSLHTTDFVRSGRDLKWETSREFNFGLEAVMFDRKLSAEVNYFDELRDNIITGAAATYSSIVGDFNGNANLGRVSNHGVDAQLNWTDHKGDFSYRIGANALWSVNKLEAWNEVNYIDDGWKTVGKPTDAIIGYRALGLFGKDVNLATATPQNLGQYGDGYIAYENINGDGIVDERDQTMIGNSFPRLHLGLDVDLHFGNWGLYVLGTAALGSDNMLSSSYYWMSGTGKYSVVALDRYHPVNNPEGTYPALTTTSGNNNFVKSTFWLQNASFFRLKNVELSYTLPVRNFAVKKFKLFARGSNLCVLSEMKDLDPETPNAGLTSYPYYATVTGGLSLTF